MAAVGYLGGVVILEAWPVYHFLTARFRGVPFAEAGMIPLVLGISGAALLSMVAVAVPLRAGIRRVQSLDF